jgi:hypothetical protein
MLLCPSRSGEVVQKGMYDRTQVDNATCHDKNQTESSRKVKRRGKDADKRQTTRLGRHERRLNGHEEIRYAKRAIRSPQPSAVRSKILRVPNLGR